MSVFVPCFANACISTHVMLKVNPEYFLTSAKSLQGGWAEALTTMTWLVCLAWAPSCLNSRMKIQCQRRSGAESRQRQSNLFSIMLLFCCDKWFYILIVLDRNDTTDSLGGKEKLLLSQECELVTLMSRVKGRLDITNTHVSFNDMSPAKEDADRFDFKVSFQQLKLL